MIRADARKFPSLRSWTERLGAWLAREWYSRLFVRHNELNQRLTASQKAGVRLAVQVAELQVELLRAKRALGHALRANMERRAATCATLVVSEATAEDRPSHLVPGSIRQNRTSDRANVSRVAERFAELKYRQLKQHVQHLKAELRGASESSAYLECLELFEQIPQLRHIATRYLHTQDAGAIEADVQVLLDRLPWLRDQVERDPMGIRLVGDPPRDQHVMLRPDQVPVRPSGVVIDGGRSDD